MSGITVDRDFVRVGEKAYAINKINSVEVRTKTIKGARGYIFFWFFGVIFGLASLGTAVGPEPGSALGILGIAALLTFFGLLSFRRRHTRAEYQLFLVTSSGEAAALQTQDRDEVNQTRAAIERAIAAH